MNQSIRQILNTQLESLNWKLGMLKEERNELIKRHDGILKEISEIEKARAELQEGLK